MPTLSIGGFGISHGIVTMPSYGAWWAELQAENDDASNLTAGSQQTLQMGDLQLQGTILPSLSGQFKGATYLRMVGGKGGLTTIAKPKHYQQAPLSIPLNDVLTTAGESLSSTVSAAATGTLLARWTVFGHECSKAIDLLARSLGTGYRWRILADGTVWLGQETHPAVDSAYDYLVDQQFPNENRLILSVAQPAIVPGQLLTGFGNVSYVVHRVTPGSARSHLWLE